MLGKKEFSRHLANNILKVRTKKGISQEELAHQAGLYRTYVGHIENGRYLPSSFTIYKIAKALHVPVQEIYP